MNRLIPLRFIFSLVALAALASCSGTKVVHQWHNDAGQSVQANNLAVIAMLPEEGMRLGVEKMISDEINAAGGKSVASTTIRGMRGKLTREKAEAALKEFGSDAVVLVFITGAVKGEKLERADYYAQYEGTMIYNDWFAPQFTDVYSIHEGSGYYEQERTLFLESSYLEFPSTEVRWNMVTESSALEYRATARVVAGKIIAQMKKDGAL